MPKPKRTAPVAPLTKPRRRIMVIEGATARADVDREKPPALTHEVVAKLRELFTRQTNNRVNVSTGVGRSTLALKFLKALAVREGLSHPVRRVVRIDGRFRYAEIAWTSVPPGWAEAVVRKGLSQKVDDGVWSGNTPVPLDFHDDRLRFY